MIGEAELKERGTSIVKARNARRWDCTCNRRLIATAKEHVGASNIAKKEVGNTERASIKPLPDKISAQMYQDDIVAVSVHFPPR